MTQREQASDPNTPPAQLIVLAADYPEEVSANPAVPLLLLEDPGFAAKLELGCTIAQLRRVSEKIHENAIKRGNEFWALTKRGT